MAEGNTERSKAVMASRVDVLDERGRALIENVQRRTAVGAEAVLHPDGIKNLPEGDKALIQDRLREQLGAAMNAEARVKIFAKWTDTYGLDAILGMIPGDISDAVSAVGYVAYLMMEAKNAGLEKKEIAKIVGWQSLDALIGLIPFLDPLVDYFICKANVRSAEIFKRHTEKLIMDAKAQGIDEKAIAELQRATREMEKKLGLIGSVAGAFSQQKKRLPPPEKR